MVNGYDVEEYRKIKAPAELKQRVISAAVRPSARSQFFGYKTVSALAACVLLFIVCTAFFGGSDSAVSIGIDTVAPANASSRMANSVTLVIESEGKIDFSTSDDGFYLYDANGKSYTPLKEEKGVKNRLEVQWTVSDKEAEFVVNHKNYSVSVDDSGSVNIKVEK